MRRRAGRQERTPPGVIFADYQATVYPVLEQLRTSGLVAELRDAPTERRTR